MATVQSQSSGAPSQPGAQAAAQMGAAARKFFDSLTTEQKARATFEYMDGERMYWYYPPINRHGLALRDMDANQRELAFALLASGLTQRSYEQARQIIEHEDVLGPLEKEMGMITFVRDIELYYFTIFGEPGSKEPWGWRCEGTSRLAALQRLGGQRHIGDALFLRRESGGGSQGSQAGPAHPRRP